jgi:hypothetical protein
MNLANGRRLRSFATYNCRSNMTCVARAALRFPDVKVAKPTDPSLIGVGIAVEATNRDQFVCPEGTEEYLAWLRESVHPGAPLGDELVHEAEALSIGLGT